MVGLLDGPQIAIAQSQDGPTVVGQLLGSCWIGVDYTSKDCPIAVDGQMADRRLLDSCMSDCIELRVARPPAVIL